MALTPAEQYRQKVNFHFICSRTFEEYGFDRITWNFFEAGHGKGAADGVGGYLKRTADQKVASGSDIPDAETFFQALKDSSKIQLYFIANADIEKVEQTVPKDVIPLRGTMQVHQVFTETAGELHYRDLSCFCERGFCDCLAPQTYRPILVIEEEEDRNQENEEEEEEMEEVNAEEEEEERAKEEEEKEGEVLTDLTNLVTNPKRTFYQMVYSPASSSDDEPLSKIQLEKDQEASVPNRDEQNLIEKENLHPAKIFMGVYVIVKVSSDKDKTYFYLGVAQSNVDDEGEIKIMFLKSVDDSGKRFKLVEKDVSFEPYENISEIVPNPKKVKKGRRVYYEFDVPLNIFEK